MTGLLIGLAIGIIIGLLIRDWLDPKKPFESSFWLNSLDNSHTKIIRLPISEDKIRQLAIRVIRNQSLTYKALTPGIMSRVELYKVRSELIKRGLIEKGVKGEIIPTPPLIEFFRNELISLGMERNEMIFSRSKRRLSI